jgi:hypothetical protein
MVLGFSPFIATLQPCVLLEPGDDSGWFSRVNLGGVILGDSGKNYANQSSFHGSSILGQPQLPNR